MLEKTLENPLDTRRSNQSLLMAINPEYSLERMVLNLHYFVYLMESADSLAKTLMLEKTEAKGEQGGR